MPAIPTHRESLAVKVMDDVAVIGLLDTASVLDGERATSLGRELFDLIDDKKFTKVVLNLHNTSYMPSAMLAQLIQLRRKMQSIHGQLRLCALRPPVVDAFKVSQFDKLFEIFPDEPSALRSF
jgi:anti-sigma B factor antagonist